MALENQAASAGLRINGQKAKVVHIGYINSRVPITIDGKKWRKLQTSLILAVLSPQTGMQNEMSSATSVIAIATYERSGR